MATPSRVGQPGVGLIKGLGLLDATTIVMGSMIGSGIFIVPADIYRQVQSPGLGILVWVVTALLTVTAALCYGELAAAMPQAGGQYVYLREAFGPLFGFLYGWTLFLVIQTGTIAAVAVAFAKFAGVFFPWIAQDNVLIDAGFFRFDTTQLVAIAVLILLTYTNTRGLRTGAIIQNIFTTTKVAALLALIGLGVFFGGNSAAATNFTDFWGDADWSFTSVRLVGVAMVGSLFSSDAWNNVTFTGGEIRNPKRNLPLALGLGTAAVSLLYLACNYVYLNVLPIEAIQQASNDRVGTAVMQAMLGPVAQQVMAAAIMISTFGCINGMVLAGARVYYAMALDNLFFKSVAKVDPKHRTPTVSLAVQCVWACLLTLTGRYSDLLDYVIFSALLFFVLTILGIFVLRRTKPELERPYRAIGYPVLPALYVIAAGTIEVLLLLYKPNYTFPGLMIVLCGVPVYFVWRKHEVKA